jgi:hypothetical protein
VLLLHEDLEDDLLLHGVATDKILTALLAEQSLRQRAEEDVSLSFAFVSALSSFSRVDFSPLGDGRPVTRTPQIEVNFRAWLSSKAEREVFTKFCEMWPTPQGNFTTAVWLPFLSTSSPIPYGVEASTTFAGAAGTHG